MTVQGQASAAATSVAIPTHAAGDMILVFARGTAAAPSIPAAGGTVPAWTSLQSALANSIGLTTAAFVATAGTTTTGTWTNATHICVLVLRPAAGYALSTAAARSSTGNGNNTQTIIYPALTLSKTDGTSMGVRCGTRTVAITAVGNPPTSWTNQTIQPAGASALMSVHTRAALVANPTADTVTVTSSNAAYRAVTVEVLETTLAQSKAVGAVASAQGFGTVDTVEGAVAVAAGAVSSPQAFGTIIATVVAVGPQTAVVSGVGSAQSFGISAAAVGPVTRPVTGLGSAQSFGAITPKGAVTRAVTGLGSAQAFGAVSAWVAGAATSVTVPGLTLYTTVLSISGGVISGDGHLCGSAVYQLGQFGAVGIQARITVPVAGVPSAQAVGVVKAATPLHVGVSSAQAFGVVTAQPGVVLVPVLGLGTAASFGTPKAFHAFVHDLVCVTLPIEGVPVPAELALSALAPVALDQQPVTPIPVDLEPAVSR